MIKYRVIYILVLSAAVVFAAAYESRLTLILLVTLFALPVVSFLILLMQRAALAFEVTPKSVFTTKQRRFSITLKIQNRFIFPISPMKITGVFQDTEGNLITDKLMIVSVMPFGKSEFIFNGHLKYRGEYFLGITGAEIYDFLGIFGMKIKFTPDSRVVVAPRRLMIGQNGALCSDDNDSLRTEFTFFENDSFSSVREYADGDSLRRVHWKLSAKMDKLMVKQSDLNLSSSAAIVIDTSTVNCGEVRGECEVDAVLEAALAIARKVIGEGSSAACIYCGETGEPEACVAQTAEDYEFLYYQFSVVPVLERTEGAAGLVRHGAKLLGENELAFIIAPELKAEELRSALSGGLSRCKSIRIFLTSGTPDDEFISVVNDDPRIRVAEIDPENIAASLETALFD